MMADENAGRNRSRGQAAKVAVVAEDDPGVRLLLTVLLGSEGWEVHATDTGSNVVDLIESYSPVLCLLDIMMPGMSGVEAMADAQGQGHGQDDGTVFVMLTALDDDDEVRRAVMAGADDYITKPFDISDLTDRLERWCGATGWELIAPAQPGDVHDHLLFDHSGGAG